MASSAKRKASDPTDRAPNKEKKSRPWYGPTRNGAREGQSIRPGDAGIWATCDKGRENKAKAELADLCQEYAEKLYGEAVNLDAPADGIAAEEQEADVEADIEAEIKDEVKSMRKPAGKTLFTSMRIDLQCVLLMKTRDPVDPVELVHDICRDLLQTGSKKARFVKRLTPVAKFGKATEAGLQELAKEVLAPHFHTGGDESRTFAIRPTIRNHGDKTLTREKIIQLVAPIVGENHKVDLSKPDLTILVEVYKFHCGMSIVGSDFDQLKRFNLAEILYPSAKGDPNAKQASASPLPGAAQV